MYTEYINFLNKEFSSDYWSDLGIDEAITLMDDFNSEDWELLRNEIKNANPKSQVRCAQTLGDSYSKQAFEVLMVLTKSSDVSVVVASLDSLSSMGASSDSLISNATELKTMLSDIKNSDFVFTDLEHMVINSFESKLNKVL